MRNVLFFFQKSSSAAKMAVSDWTIYEFADFRLIPKDDLLLRNGEPISLPPKAFSTLILLIENHGHLVRKEELIEKIWPDTHVEEAAVSKCVWAIRNALGEDPKSHWFIETVPKRGYKFVAEVSVRRGSDRFREITDSNAKSTAAFDSNTPEHEKLNAIIGRSPAEETHQQIFPRGFFRHRHRYAIFAIALLAVGAVVAYISYPWETTSSEGGPVTIAVLPFKPVNTPKGDTLYDLGITETLINKLSALENFRVRSLASVRQYVQIDSDALAVGNEQKVEYVLDSNYQVVDGKIRITAQLVNVRAARTAEAYDFQKDATDIFTAQDAVALELKDRLALKFGGREVGPSTRRGTDNAEAYRYYLLARNFNELRGPENGRIALEQIDQALALDPNFARAWATKAYIHRYMGYGTVAVEHSLKSIEAVEKALALDPDLSEAHSTLCFNKFRFEYDFEGAERACKRAIELDPTSPLAHKLYSNFLYTRGRFDEAIAAIERAIDLQPVSYDNQQTYALALYFARRYADAEAQWKKLIPLNPNHRLIYGHLVSSLVLQGKEPEALEHLIRLLTIEKTDEQTIRRFRNAFARSGWRGVTRERIRLVESRPDPRKFDLARLYSTIGDENNAFKYLEQAYQERSNMIAVLEVDPELDLLRSDPRYRELLRRVAARDFW